MISCKHNLKARLDGLCQPCSELKPFVQFRICSKSCMACAQCGYFWGPGNDKQSGQPIYPHGWTPDWLKKSDD